MQIVRYKPARLGYGTESSQKLQPIDFAPNIINRYYNILGDLEKRRGMVQLGATITSALSNDVTAQITNLHEYIDSSGHSTLFASGNANATGTNRQYGLIWRYNEVSAYWEQVLNSYEVRSPNKMYSVQMNNKLIFCNSPTSYIPVSSVFELDYIERNIFIENPSAGVSANFTQQLYSTITKGTTASGTSEHTLVDADISNWKTQTNVAVNDLVITQVSGSDTNGLVLQGAGIITSVGTSSLDITTISANANGIGGSGAALASGMGYRIVDLVELNIIPTSAAGGIIYDNVAVAGASTSAGAITVTAINLIDNGIRVGDYVYNTTRAAITQITGLTATSGFSVTQNVIRVKPIGSQAAGDSLVFLKDAMPLATYPHVHYGQLFLIDARDTTKIRVSGPNDPEDFTTFSKTLASSTVDYGSKQPKADILLTMSTFQQYFVVGGQQQLYVVAGTTPIADTTADVINLTPAGLFTQGIMSPAGLQSISNEMLYIGKDGLRTFLAAFSFTNTTTTNKCEQIKSEIITAIQAQQALGSSLDSIQLVHYPRRNWVMMKIGDIIYNYNYTPQYQAGQILNTTTFTKFAGLLAQQDAFYVRRNGDLVTGDETGRIYTFDVSGVYKDNTANIQTTYTSPWHTLQEGQNDLTLINKDGRYIKPIFETSAAIKYNISVAGGWDNLSSDSVVVTSQVSGITQPKTALRWRGQQAQITITTDTSVGADIINSYTLYGNVFGRR